MSSERDLIAELMLSEPTVAKLTENAVGTALEGFELAPRRNLSWIARAIQGAIYASIKPADERADRPSNAEVRDELLRIAGDCSKLWLRLSERSSEADGAIWDRAFRSWVAAARDDIKLPEIGEPPEYAEFDKALLQIEWLSHFLSGAANALEPQPPNWRRAEEREERVLRAQYLSPIFEEGFGVEPTLNRWPTARSLGPWADFYQRIVALAFGERATPNLEDVLREARRRDRAHRVSFGPGVIPN